MPGLTSLRHPTGLLATAAEPQADGNQPGKIFISAAEHDVAPNRSSIWCYWPACPTRPKGSKCISLFVVPKFHVNADGSVGARNPSTARAWSTRWVIRNATAQIAPSTALAIYGGERTRPAAMFVMMNAARLGVGNQSLGLTEVALQKRAGLCQGPPLQMRSLGRRLKDNKRSTIIVQLRRAKIRLSAIRRRARALQIPTRTPLPDGGAHHPDGEGAQA